MSQVETVQYFQFDKEGNMYVFPAGSGCSGVPKLVHPGEEFLFEDGEDVNSTQSSCEGISQLTCDGIQTISDTQVVENCVPVRYGFNSFVHFYCYFFSDILMLHS